MDSPVSHLGLLGKSAKRARYLKRSWRYHDQCEEF